SRSAAACRSRLFLAASASASSKDSARSLAIAAGGASARAGGSAAMSNIKAAEDLMKHRDIGLSLWLGAVELRRRDPGSQGDRGAIRTLARCDHFTGSAAAMSPEVGAMSTPSPARTASISAPCSARSRLRGLVGRRWRLELDVLGRVDAEHSAAVRALPG